MNRDEQVKRNLLLVEKHLLDLIAHPEKLYAIPDGAQIIFIPVPRPRRDVWTAIPLNP